jgi:hypothetical protein
MVNTCKPSLNVVIRSKPKMLIGLDQKVRGLEQELWSLPSQTTKPPADRRDLNDQ